MRKQIDGSTKYETVRQIEAGKISIRHAAEQLGVHPSSVQAWVWLYETEGISGFAKQKDQVYSEAQKVKAVEHIRFRYTGPSLEAVLDRLPTAQVLPQDEAGWLISAEVFGKGIDMWLKSQGEWIEQIQ